MKSDGFESFCWWWCQVSGITAHILMSSEGWGYCTAPKRRQDIQYVASVPGWWLPKGARAPSREWGGGFPWEYSSCLMCPPHPPCLTASQVSDAFLSCCLGPTYAQGGSDFTGLLPTGSFAWPTAQDERQHARLLRPGRDAISRSLGDIHRRHRRQDRLFWRWIVAHLWDLKECGSKQCVHLIWMLF